MTNPLLAAARCRRWSVRRGGGARPPCAERGLRTGLDTSAISRNPAVVQQYRDDGLVHSTGTPRLSAEIDAARKWTGEHAADLRVPFLMILGGADRLVPPAGGRRFFERVTLADKELKEYPGAYHEPHNDIIAEQVMTDLARWLEARLT